MAQEELKEYSLLARSVEIEALYEHYRGLVYKVLSIARHSETLEELIVYQAQYGSGDIWVRPLAMFLETVVIDGKEKPRFSLLSNSK